MATPWYGARRISFFPRFLVRQALSPGARGGASGWAAIPAVQRGALRETVAILQPGPAALFDGLDALHAAIADVAHALDREGRLTRAGGGCAGTPKLDVEGLQPERQTGDMQGQRRRHALELTDPFDAAAPLSPSLKSAAPKPLCAENRMRCRWHR